MKRLTPKKVIWAVSVALVLFFMSGDTLYAGKPILQIAKAYTFSIPGWEVQNFPKKWLHLVQEPFRKDRSQAEKIAQVRRYFELNDQVNDLQSRINEVALGFREDPNLPETKAQLHNARDHRDALRADVEETLEAMITKEYKEANTFRNFLGTRIFWPPVDIRLDAMPKNLIVSPRDRIEISQTRLMEPGMTLEEIEALEDRLDRRNISTLVEDLGGVATYPAFVTDRYSLYPVLTTASHEWVHHYLFYHPLGHAYYASGQMTAINETVADAVGDEIGRAVYKRYFATSEEIKAMDEEDARRAEEQQTPATPRPTRPPSDPNVFNFSAEMRETRITAEKLLSEGKIDEAEAYMEKRRLYMVENGNFIRKINQAFFAFHGNYTESASSGSVSPIAGQVRAVRNASTDIGQFLRRVADYSKPDDLVKDAVRAGGSLR